MYKNVTPDLRRKQWCLASNVKLQLHDAIYRLRFFSNSLIHILSLSNSHHNVASIQKDRGDKSHRVIVALTSFAKPLGERTYNFENE